MKRILIFAAAVLALAFGASAGDNPKVALDTSRGKIVLELYADKAPQTVKNFMAYVDAGFYNSTVFHRVIPDFMIQGGGFTADMQQKSTRPPIRNEAENGLLNLRGTIAMARTPNPHSATAQFFINTVDNEALNHRDKSPRGWGYAVFGRCIDGMSTVEKINAVETINKGSYENVPVAPVIVESATLLVE